MQKKQHLVLAVALIALGCLMLGAGVIHRFLLLNSYKSTVKIKEMSGQLWDGKQMSISSPAPFDPYWIQTEFEKIQSKVILFQVISNLNLNRRWAEKFKTSELRNENIYPLLKRQLEVRQPRNTSLMEISVWSEDPVEAAAIANEVAHVYCESRRASQRQMTEGGIRGLETELEKQTRLIPEAQALVERLRRELNITATDDQTDNVASLPPDDKRRPYFAAKAELETIQLLQERLKVRIDVERKEALIERRHVEIIDAAEPPSRPARPNRIAGAALLMVGLVSILSGVLLLVRSEREPSPAEPQCSDA